MVRKVSSYIYWRTHDSRNRKKAEGKKKVKGKRDSNMEKIKGPIL